MWGSGGVRGEVRDARRGRRVAYNEWGVETKGSERERERERNEGARTKKSTYLCVSVSPFLPISRPGASIAWRQGRGVKGVPPVAPPSLPAPVPDYARTRSPDSPYLGGRRMGKGVGIENTTLKH